MSTPPTADPDGDPIVLLRRIDPDAIRDRLAELERDRRALLVLLRAICRRAIPTGAPVTAPPREGAGRG